MSNPTKVLQVAKNNQYFICKKWYKLHKRSNRKINCTIRIKGTNTIANIKSNKIVQVA